LLRLKWFPLNPIFALRRGVRKARIPEKIRRTILKTVVKIFEERKKRHRRLYGPFISWAALSGDGMALGAGAEFSSATAVPD
jgi:hypothetical protein